MVMMLNLRIHMMAHKHFFFLLDLMVFYEVLPLWRYVVDPLEHLPFGLVQLELDSFMVAFALVYKIHDHLILQIVKGLS